MPIWSKAWRILLPSQRRTTAWLFLLLLAGMLLEMLSLGMVVPALAFMATDDPTATSPKLATFLAWLGNPSRDQLVVGGMVVLLAIAVVKTVFLAYIAWTQSKLSAAIYSSVGQRLFGIYLSQPWTFHLQRNSAELIRNTAYESGVFSNVVSAFLFVCTDALIMLGIVVLLLFIQPLGAILSAAALGLSTVIFQRATQPAIARWGKARQHHEAKRLQHLQQGLGGAKDVKILGREAAFIDAFQAHNVAHAHVLQRQGLVGQLPRLWYELVAVAGLCVLSLTMIVLRTPAAAFVPTLGLFAACAFKLLPSINRMIVNLQTVRFVTPVVNTLFTELNLPVAHAPANCETPLAFERAIEVNDVSFRYPGASADALHSVSLRIPKGTAVGLIGESGAGKSTLVDILLGLLTPSSGSLTVDGVSIATNPRAWQRLIGYVPQSIYLSDDTLRRNIAFGIPDAEIDEAAIARSLNAAQLEEFVTGLPEGMHTFVGERGIRLSGGQRQRIGIARALYHNPSVLVLDEATSALDNDTEQGVMEAVNSLHGMKTLIIIAHRLTTVAKCDVVYKLRKGSVAESGKLADIASAAAH